MTFEIFNFDGEYILRVFHNGKKLYFSEKLNLNPKEKSIFNSLKRLPNFFGDFKLIEVPVLDLLANSIIKYKDKEYRVINTFHTLEFDFEKFYINGVEAIFLTNDYVLADNIYKVDYIEDIMLNFKTKKIDNNYLSMLFSNFGNLDIKGYNVNYLGELKAKPALFIEEVVDKNLVFRVGRYIDGVDVETDKIALLQDRDINVFEVDDSLVFEKLDEIKKIFKSKKIQYIEDDGFFVLEKKYAEMFLSILPEIIFNMEFFGNKHLKDFKLKVIRPTLNVTINRGIDLLELEGDVVIENETMPLSEFLKQYKKENYITIKNKNYLIESDYLEKLKRVIIEDKDKLKVSFFDLPEIEKLVSNKDNEVFKKSREFYEGFNKLKSKKIKINLNAKLRDYQKYGVKWLKYLKENSFGGCLADDMGLGKTIQALGVLVDTKNSIVVVPKSLLLSWEDEIKKFAPNLNYYIYYGQNRELKDGVMITTYGTLRSDIDKIKDKEFEVAILDEAHHIKNINSQIHKAVMLINAKHKFALSGTPIENSLSELYSLFRFINPGMFRSFEDFKRKYLIPIEQDKNIEVMNELKTKISPFILRRLKSEVLKELPKKQEFVIKVELNENHKELYKNKKEYFRQMIVENIKLKGFNKSKLSIFQALTKLRQIASIPEIEEENIRSSKLNVMFEQLEDIISNKHKVLIFTNFLYSIDLIAKEAEKRGFSYVTMSGATSNRQAIVDKFLNEDIDLFIMTLKTGGVGLNLTKADYVFIFEPWWNSAAESQAIDRVYRIGQKNNVFSYKLIAKDTIEEKILKLQEIKKDLSNIVDINSEIKIDEKDLEFLLGE